MEIIFDAADPQALATFWTALTGVEFTFVLSSEPKTVKNRVHLDLASTSPEDQMDIVARAEELGARRIDIGQGDVPWVVLADPEGNEFCVLEPRPEYTPPLAAVVIDVPDPRAAAEATGLPVVNATDEDASIRLESGPWLEFLRTDDPAPVTDRVRASWADPR